ncbi:type IX secretion system periplasmic lipoprotein PorW/SprE [Parapedobacter soli]|uniref:type IX secretion system periplasmic lipoprotein PorW/SprE n=1 Tax=Parapedobacter soli TaxID=416955 RepID=UPI0021C6E9B6|nr:tetratricopeptide repeat protein [Parapedobacter soli]
MLVYCVVAGCAANREKDRAAEYDMMENLTAKFNIVYHGRKIIADVTRQNFEAHHEDYQQLLPVLIEPTEATSSSNTQLMDSVIGKALNIINHKGKSKYINEAYLLTGKANYLKGNYYNAVEFFTYLANTFADMPEYRQAALVWKARSLMQLGNLTDAGSVLDTVFAGLESEKKSMGLAFATQAKYYLLVHDEESAITMLEQAIEHTRLKPIKLRWHFLLGQLLQQSGRKEEAYGHYSRVVRSNAPYEMSFYAALNRVFLTTGENSTGEQRVRLLRRMLRDGKNKEFRDQIYYQIATVFYEDGYLPEALANYELALRQESSNRYQTTLTYLKLADHYFAATDYPTAKLYYDSVGMVLPVDFPNAGEVQRKIANLDELIAQLTVVAHQDSLQYLARLDETTRRTEIDSILTRSWLQYQAKKVEPAKQRASQTQRFSPFDDMMPAAVSYTDNRFYFNNPDAMGMGQAEFRRRWGNRQLKDNWRFSDMAGASVISGEAAGTVDTEHTPTEEVAAVDSTAWVSNLRQTYLDELPDTDEKMAASDTLIHNALIRVGNSYRDELLDNEAAIRTYEELLERYPSTPEAPLLYYNLYRLYSGIDDAKVALYRQKLLVDFPDSRYSHIIRDPAYLAKLEQQQRVLDRAYESVYTLYTEQQYPQVVDEVTRLLDIGDGRQQTLSQLAYLRALAWGRTAAIDTFENALRQLVSDFPGDSLITPLANQHLEFIETHRDTLATRQYALQAIAGERKRFVDEPTMTLWPQLVIRHGPESPRPRRELTVNTAGRTGLGGRPNLGNVQGIAGQQLARVAEVGDLGPNVYRDLELLPDSATYYFVINVMNARANLAPSRFGIGQFNRTRYAGQAISHQMKVINDENQLVYVGPFDSYDDVKQYETRILPLIPDIMKIPTDLYNTFVITATNFGTLSDFDKVDDYHAVYQEQLER